MCVSCLSACTGNEALGLETGRILDQQITASSSRDKNASPARARLLSVLAAASGRTGAWSAKTNDQSQWLQVDFGRNVKITKVATQGRQDVDEWVKTFTLAYSVDGSSNFQPYQVNDVDKVSISIYKI